MKYLMPLALILGFGCTNYAMRAEHTTAELDRLPGRSDPIRVTCRDQSEGAPGRLPIQTRWVGPVAAPLELTDDEQALLAAIAPAPTTRNYEPLKKWGGVLEAARAAARTEKRRDAAAGGGWIDGFETRVAITLAAGAL